MDKQEIKDVITSMLPLQDTYFNDDQVERLVVDCISKLNFSNDGMIDEGKSNKVSRKKIKG